MSEDAPITDKPPVNAAVAGSSALPDGEVNRMTDDIVSALKTVYDPEIPADIYELGLIYKIDIADDRSVKVDMSLTSPNCPAAQELPIMVENAVSSVAGVKGGIQAGCPMRRGLSSICGDFLTGGRDPI